LAAAGFVDAAFEGVPGAFGIGGGGLGLAKQLAQVEKVLLGGAALRQGRALPFGDELLRSHCRGQGSGVRGHFLNLEKERSWRLSQRGANISNISKSRETVFRSLPRWGGNLGSLPRKVRILCALL